MQENAFKWMNALSIMHNSDNQSCLLLKLFANSENSELHKYGSIKGELNPKIKFVLFERTLKLTE